MKLYDIQKGSKIRLPITDGKTEKLELCTLENLDGVYSRITTESGNIVHLNATADLKLVDGVYELREDSN
jgi:hypothetical protein